MTTETSNEIWVYIDQRAERFFDYGLNILAKARDLSETISGKVAAVLVGSTDQCEPDQLTFCLSTAEAEQKCISHGADKVYVLFNGDFSTPRADYHAAFLAEAVKERSPKLVLFALTEFGREIAAIAARRCNSGLIADCVDIRIESEGIIALSPSWGGEILAGITFTEGFGTGFATIQPHAFQAIEQNGDPGSIERISLGDISVPAGMELVSRSLESAQHRKLEEADIVVVGGAGLGTPDNFGMVRQLAVSLGGEVGATRPPVLLHWVDEERLIGQTGKTVHPNLLFSIGTSGAVQYTAGIMESKHIVAVNRDANSPIFQVADIGIVADVKNFLPIFIEKVNQTVMRKLADALSDNDEVKMDSGFGARIRKLREAHDWTAESLAQATGQSPEFIKQVENNELSPSVSFLLGLARALDVDPGTFLRREEQTQIRDMRQQAYVKRTQDYAYQSLTDGGESDHLQAFFITIEAKQTHKPVAYKHEGEEFVYVIEGELGLTIGNKEHVLKSGDTMHYNSDIPHKLKNTSSETTRLLVVLYTI